MCHITSPGSATFVVSWKRCGLMRNHVPNQTDTNEMARIGAQNYLKLRNSRRCAATYNSHGNIITYVCLLTPCNPIHKGNEVARAQPQKLTCDNDFGGGLAADAHRFSRRPTSKRNGGPSNTFSRLRDQTKAWPLSPKKLT